MTAEKDAALQREKVLQEKLAQAIKNAEEAGEYSKKAKIAHDKDTNTLRGEMGEIAKLAQKNAAERDLANGKVFIFFEIFVFIRGYAGSLTHLCYSMCVGGYVSSCMHLHHHNMYPTHVCSLMRPYLVHTSPRVCLIPPAALAS